MRGSKASAAAPGTSWSPCASAAAWARRASSRSPERQHQEEKGRPPETAAFFFPSLAASRDGHAAVDDESLAGDEASRARRQQYGRAGDIDGLTDHAERRLLQGLRQKLLVLPKRAREIRLDQAGRDGVDADVVLAPFDGEAAGELHVCRFRDAVGAEHRAAAQAADAGDDDDSAVLALRHIRDDHIAEPEIAPDIAVHDAVEGVVGYFGKRPEIGVDRGVADEDVDRAEGLPRLVDEPLQRRLVADMGGDANRLAARPLDAGDDFLAGLGLAPGHHDVGAAQRPLFGNGAPDPSRTTGGDPRLPGEIENLHASSHFTCLVPMNRLVARYWIGGGSQLPARAGAGSGRAGGLVDRFAGPVARPIVRASCRQYRQCRCQDEYLGDRSSGHECFSSNVVRPKLTPGSAHEPHPDARRSVRTMSRSLPTRLARCARAIIKGFDATCESARLRLRPATDAA